MKSILTHQKQYIQNSNGQGARTKVKMKRLEQQIEANHLICFKCSKRIHVGDWVNKARSPGSGSSIYRHKDCVRYI